MALVLDYFRFPRRDYLTTILASATSILLVFDSLAALFLGNWHNGLRSIPVYAHLQIRDVVATIGICGTPILGILLGLLLIWRCRRGRWAGVILGIGAVICHAQNLYVWGSMEVWFWSG